jgi:UPF0716 protein FxsA
MFRWLIAIFILVPAVEIWGLVVVSRSIGGWQTFAFILLTGLAGAYLAKREGARVWHFARVQLSQGQLPANSILDGICIFIGGLLLLLPGFVSDIAGLLLLLPVTRPVFKLLLLRAIRKRLAKGSFRLYRR